MSIQTPGNLPSYDQYLTLRSSGSSDGGNQGYEYTKYVDLTAPPEDYVGTYTGTMTVE